MMPARPAAAAAAIIHLRLLVFGSPDGPLGDGEKTIELLGADGSDGSSGVAASVVIGSFYSRGFRNGSA